MIYKRLVLQLLLMIVICSSVFADFTLPNYDGDLNQVMVLGASNVLYWSDVEDINSITPQPDPDLNIVGQCFIPTNSCDDEYLVTGAGFCDYNIVLPDDANRIYVEIIHGSYNDMTSTAFFVDNNFTMPIWVDKKTMPIYLICKEASSTYFVQDVIDTLTLGIDENYNVIEVTKTYDTTTRSDAIVLVLAGLLLVIGLYGMIIVIRSRFK